MKTSTKLCVGIMLVVLIILGVQAMNAAGEVKPSYYIAIGGVR